MKLIKAIKKKGHPVKVPNCSRDELPNFFKEMGFKVGAEIGVYKGEFTEKFCQKGLKMYAIDNWSVYRFAGRALNTQGRQDVLYEHAKKRLAQYKDCTVIRKNSVEVVRDFKPGSLDFVYLDGDHIFRGIADDIYEWYGVVRKGGVISGHDYAYTGNDPKSAGTYHTFCHVGVVVDAFVKAFRIENYYIFGRSKRLEDEQKNDRYLSFMFFKP